MTAPVFLFTGPEAGERNETLKTTINSLKKKFGDTEEYHFYASETPVQEFMTVLQNESLFAGSTCVVVKNAEVIKKKEDIEMISSWISSCTSETSVLIFTSDSISVDTKLEKLIPPSNKKVFWEMFEDRKVPWIVSYFRKNGYNITDDAAELILEMIENNTETLKNECSRFFILFPKEHAIVPEDVESVLTHTREENAFSLFDAMSASPSPANIRFEKSLEILQKIRLSKDNSSVLILAGLTSCFRKVVLWHKLKNEGKNDDFNLKINGFSGKTIKAQYERASKIWTSGQATAILADIATTDMQIRSGGTLMEDVLLQKLLYEIIIKKGATCASYEVSI